MAAEPVRPYWKSSVSDIDSDEIYIRGYALRELMGALPFPAIAVLMIRGRVPTPGESRMMDVILTSVLDYALHKSGTVAARCVVSVNPQMTAGLAAAVLAAGEHALSPENAGRFVAEYHEAWKASGEAMEAYATKLAEQLCREKKRVPGFGHPVFRGVDPRAQRLREVAVETGVWGELGDFYEAVHRAFRAAVGKPHIVINDVGMMAAILADMGYSPQEMAGLAILSTIPGIIAHISEELASGVRNRIVPDSAADYARARRDLKADMRSAGWPTNS
jgi:citrate synthase